MNHPITPRESAVAQGLQARLPIATPPIIQQGAPPWSDPNALAGAAGAWLASPERSEWVQHQLEITHPRWHKFVQHPNLNHLPQRQVTRADIIRWARGQAAHPAPFLTPGGLATQRRI